MPDQHRTGILPGGGVQAVGGHPAGEAGAAPGPPRVLARVRPFFCIVHPPTHGSTWVTHTNNTHTYTPLPLSSPLSPIYPDLRPPARPSCVAWAATATSGVKGTSPHAQIHPYPHHPPTKHTPFPPQLHRPRRTEPRAGLHALPWLPAKVPRRVRRLPPLPARHVCGPGPGRGRGGEGGGRVPDLAGPPPPLPPHRGACVRRVACVVWVCWRRR